MRPAGLFLLALALTACSAAGAEQRPDDQGEPTCAALDSDRDGLDECQDRCPVEAEDRDDFEDGDGCPDLDNDHDGIPDTEDRCPCHAEDEDDFGDEDGCPDPDNDRDRIPDACDACPNEPETFDGREDGDGCPEIRVLLRVDRIMILERVQFARNSVEIQERYRPLLEEVAQVMRHYPHLRRVEVSGHTDHTERRPERLGQRRAEAVIEALVALGVERERLIARSWGAERPIASPDTSEGRERNRRVEYNILEPEGGTGGGGTRIHVDPPASASTEPPGAPPEGPLALDHCPEGEPPPPLDVCEEERRQRRARDGS